MKSLCATGRNLYCPCVPLHETLAGQPAGSDGDPGLDLLVARAARILLRIEERLDARPSDSPSARTSTRPAPTSTRRERETPSSRSRSPARYAMPRNTGISVTAVPRSGCLAMSSSGTAVKMPPMIEVAGVASRRAGSRRSTSPGSARATMRAELRRLQVERPDRDPALRAHLRRALDQHEEQQRARARRRGTASARRACGSRAPGRRAARRGR